MARQKSNRSAETGNMNGGGQEQRGGNGGGGNIGSASQTDIDPEQVAARAYEIYMREGGVHGRDMDHWLQAEAELRSEGRPGSAAASEQNVARSARQHQAG